MAGWFATGEDNETAWKLDIVGLLAVLGESAMADHSQAMTASWLCALPRIIPAPQALLKPSRPLRLPAVNAFVVGVYNGIYIETLNYFPSILHPIGELSSYAFKVYTIRHRGREPSPTVTRIHTSKETSTASDTELGHFTSQDFQHCMSLDNPKPYVPSKSTSPLNFLSIFSCLLSVALLVLAIIKKDGTACVALGTICIVSSILGLASKWSPVLMRRAGRTKVPSGDVVIRTRQGALIVVHCNEDVGRELYSGAEECTYTIGNNAYRILVGLGTFLLMVSVVLLGNCRFTMQLAIGVSYIVLNGLFWGAALYRKDRLWDMSSYVLTDDTPSYAKDADINTDDTAEGWPSFTRTLWYAIRETKKIGWVQRGGAAPRTRKWEQWLEAAERNAVMGNVFWDAVNQKQIIVGQTDTEPRAGNESADVEQHAPASEVPAPSRR